jgi:homoserine O-succinyltransferase/O-acetyltransferase
MSAAPCIEPQGGRALEIALVNNMPDQAVETTVAQFTRLLRAGAQGADICLRCYALPSVPRSDMARRALAQTHEPISALYARGADALIVTGAEPRASDLASEPYWEEFARLVDWARANTLGALWSCLAAHGAVLRLDGVARRREAHKISGVFPCEIAVDDWAMQGAAKIVQTPHSRYNSLARDELESRGYRISSWSPAVGVDSFWRREPSLFLFLQGHPEYDADTLSREFRRDALRYINGESVTFPPTPLNYFSPAAMAGVADLRGGADGMKRARFAERLSSLLEQEAPQSCWRQDAERLYRNFLLQVAARKSAEMRRIAS